MRASSSRTWTIVSIRALAVSTLLTACGDTTGGSDGPDRFMVGGTTSGLVGTVVLRINGGDGLMLATNGSFTFATRLANGSSYTVTVHSQPVGQTCVVANSSGTIAGADVANVLVSCSANAYAIGGTVSGLIGSVVLRNNGGDDLSRNANGAFAFATSILHGSAYAVTVQANPAGQTCVVTNGSGMVAGANVTNVAVNCTTTSFAVGGTVSGLVGEGCVLQNNGGDNLTVSSGVTTFNFPTFQLTGAPYNAAIAVQPIGPNQACTLLNSSGAVAGQNVSSIALTCSVIRPDCSAATILGSISGDVAGAPITQTGTGEGWFRVRRDGG